jgi:hypothetical protein
MLVHKEENVCNLTDQFGLYEEVSHKSIARIAFERKNQPW